MQFESTIDDQSFEVNIDDDSSFATVNGKEMPYELIVQANGRVLFRTGTKLHIIDNIEVEKQTISFSIDGKFVKTVVKDDQELLLERLGFSTEELASAGLLEAPMPGKILELLVNEGDEVEEGQPVVILEAMKMENELKSPTAGTVATIVVSENDNVEKNQTILEIEPRG
ncbi:acetyl-CoA carboxylase biotin carboxyl carrier protein subunit [Rhodohalobacter barkolensis]|uniref:Acetyl-CoA carboxylase biotin carboxyl carrier protein subunit n=1 Tax=Rhodohalobacter barkolensis TaxID=2053187 RepID=A0A2N0VLF9_9BACT|nr:acetyl-CoA carboxylase biotin carboxyl carrier protein subunit [Rhodohalobacter barkolensis]PKD45022.1 acetyl-CoA carboxylase biotin carboxyl carrier protein subunit [Rhodohalobacter barkolensis]